MLTKNSSYINKNDKFVKRRYSQALENDNQNEPTKKIRKTRNSKLENDLDNLSFSEDNGSSHSIEFQGFLKHFMIPSNIYKSLSIRHKSNPIILKRNLSYLATTKSESLKSDVQTITDHLSTVRFHDENLAIMKGKCPNKPINNFPTKLIFRFEHFMDSKTEKDWKTVEALIYLDIIHFHRDNRKHKEGFIVKRILAGHKMKCNDDMKSDEIKHTIDIVDIMKSAKCFRVYKSMIHFKVLAKEKKITVKPNFTDKKSDEKNNEIFPVTYESMMPLFNNTCSRNIRSSNYFLQAGKYQIFMDVTDMEKCDDSMYCGKTTNVYNTDDDSDSPFDCQWYKIDDPQHKIINKNKARITFQIENEDQLREKQKPMQTRNKSLPPIIKMSPYKNGGAYSISTTVNESTLPCKEMRLSSVTLKEKPVVDVNIAYKFIVDKKIVQWTQTKQLKCPWCQLNFHLYNDHFDTFKQLLSHLNNWHPKLTFTCKKMKNRASMMQALSNNFITIEVKLTVLDHHELDFGHFFNEEFPARRMPLTQIIHNKHQKLYVKPHHKDHDRDYSHTWSADHLKNAEFEVDSEAEENMQWLYDQYYRKVEEFSDLNHIEKRVIQMWNKELLKSGVYVSDTQLKTFVENFVDGIIKDENQLKEVKSMRNTFMLHLVNLIDYGVLSASVMLKCMKKLDDAFDTI